MSDASNFSQKTKLVGIDERFQMFLVDAFILQVQL